MLDLITQSKGASLWRLNVESRQSAQLSTDAPKIADEMMKLNQNKTADTSSLEQTLKKIESMKDEKEKIKAWAAISAKSNYTIIDKKNCTATVYDKEGNIIKTFEVGIGRTIGDDYNDSTGMSGAKKSTTPAGEFKLFALETNDDNYSNFVFTIWQDGNKSKDDFDRLSLHAIPKSRMNERLHLFNNKTISDNRMSSGCINFLQDDFEELKTSLSKESKLFILPEESGNSLKFEKDENGQYKLTQAKYKKED